MTSSDGKSEKIIAKKQLIALVKDAILKKEKIASVSGELGERVRHAADNANLHRGAFALIVRLSRMEEDKRNDFLRSFDVYREMAEDEGLLVNQQSDMFESKEEKSAEDEQAELDAAQVAENVERLENGIKKLPDEEVASFDDSTAENPSMRNRRPKGSGAGDAPGSYNVKH